MTSVKYDPDSTIIRGNTTLGALPRWEDSYDEIPKLETGSNLYVGPSSKLDIGSKIGDNVIIEGRVKIGPETEIGDGTLIHKGSEIGGWCNIGENCEIKGFVAERTDIDDSTRFYGSTAHDHTQPHLDWDDNIEPGPNIGEEVLVYEGANIIGDVEIGDRSFILPNSLVTERVPEDHYVAGNNCMTPWRELEENNVESISEIFEYILENN